MKEFGSEFHIDYTPDPYFDEIEALKKHCYWLQSGREALLLVAKSNREGEKTILMPAYCCWSMEAPFIQEGYRIVYYRLHDDLSIDLDYLSSLIDRENPSLVLTMNYFGFTTTDDAVSLIKQSKKEIQIIEDFSHCLFSLDKIFNPDIDYYIASIRKSIGITDGAVCICDREYDGNIQNETGNGEYIRLREQAQKQKKKYLYTDNECDKLLFLEGLQTAASMLKSRSEITLHKMSAKSLATIRLTYREGIQSARTQNYEHLYNLIKNNRSFTLPFSPENKHVAPFALPILTENRDLVQRELAKNRIYAPVLWPISENAAKTCINSNRFSKQMLALPIDQRYHFHDIEELGSRINLTFK